MKFSISQASIICATLALHCGCGGVSEVSGEDDPNVDKVSDPGFEHKDAVAGPFIAIAHFNHRYLHLENVSRNELLSTIYSTPTFMLNPLNAPQNDASTGVVEEDSSSMLDPCYIIEDTITVDADGKAILRMRIDTDKCEDESAVSDEGQIKKSVRQRLYSEVSCESQDLQSFHGRRASDWAFQSLCPEDSQESFLLNLEQTTTFSQGQARLQQINRIAQFDSKGAPCVTHRADELISIDDCGHYATIATGQPNNMSVVFLQKLEGQNLRGLQGQTYYHEGKYLMQVNHWQGEVSYDSLGVTDGQQPPRFEFTRPDSNEIISGIYRFDPGPHEPAVEEADPEE